MENDIGKEIWEDVLREADKANRKPGRSVIWYVYDLKRGGKILRGAVCRDSQGRLGYSWVHKKDLKKATEKLTRHIAFERASKCDVYRFLDDWFRGRNGGKSYIPRELYASLEMIQDAEA